MARKAGPLVQVARWWTKKAHPDIIYWVSFATFTIVMYVLFVLLHVG